NEIMDPSIRETALAAHIHVDVQTGAVPARVPAETQHTRRSSKVRTNIPIPPAPYLDRKVRDLPNLAEVWSYINPYMLYGKNLGFKGNFDKLLHERDDKALELFHQMEEVKQWAAGFMRPKAVWQFFEVERDSNSIHFFSPGGTSPL